MKLALLALFSLLLLSPVGHAYSFPYTDPYYATITAGILKADHKDKSVSYRDFDLSGLPSRNAVPFFGRDRNKVTLRFWEGKPGAPLLVFLSGIGGGSAASYHNFLAYHFVKKGFHVLVLPSVFHFQFALSSSQSGTPGLSELDAADLYTVAQRGIERVREKRKLAIPSYGLLGVSMGALHAAYLAKLDRQEKRIGFQKTLLINPPVNPLFGGKSLDSLVDEGNKLSDTQKKDLRNRLYEFGVQSMVLGDIQSPEYFQQLEQKFPTSLQERKYLIGKTLGDFLEGLVFTTQQINDLGVLKNPPATTDPNPRLHEASFFRYSDYLEKILFPSLKKFWQPEFTQEELIQRSSLRGIADFLRDDPSVHLMHNADDFILAPGDIEFLQTTFGERFALYPYGGHVGNIWFPENLNRILATFSSLYP
jgi:pimeloyl-ACP methyl ester carboxylesterase